MTEHDEQTNNASEGGAAGVAGRLAEIRERIEAAARRAGRRPEDVTLVAVSKTHPPALLEAALAAGQRLFGESRLQEALPKIETIGEGRAAWHLIGHLQTNKAAQAVGRFELIHSVDSVRLLEELERRAASREVTQRVLLQVNVSGEASKFGAPPQDLSVLIETLERSPHLLGEGLMTIPPDVDDPEDVRKYFSHLRELGEQLTGFSRFAPRHLSMGMSHDFEVAVEEGATLVRVGSAIFGERDYPGK